MSEREYNPRPVFKLIADSLSVAISEQNWGKVEEIYKQLQKLSEKA